MSNIFDKIFKEESEILIRAIATKVLNIKNFDRTEPVTATLQKTIERQPDWLTKICHDNPKETRMERLAAMYSGRKKNLQIRPATSAQKIEWDFCRVAKETTKTKPPMRAGLRKRSQGSRLLHLGFRA